MIYHITTQAAWCAAQARGWYKAPSLASDGFIHCSQREQVLQVANDFYHGKSDLLLLCIDECKLRVELRWEAPAHPHTEAAVSSDDEALFPHLYGELNTDAITHAYDFTQYDDGFAPPLDLR